MKPKILFLFIVILFIPFANACKSTEASKKTKELERENIAKEKKAQKQYEDAVKAHNDRQTKATQERMLKTKERSESYNRAKRKTFWERIFGVKKRHKKPKKGL